MKIVEARGTHRQIGQAIGESLRTEIRDNLTRFARPMDETAGRELTFFTRVLSRHLPQVREQFQGMANGANVEEHRLLAFNLPYAAATDPRLGQGCTNLAFRDGPDGPLWGKNNDGLSAAPDARWALAALKLYPTDGIPAVCVTYCGWLSGGDMMNPEGLAVGHSSVGSKFQQSPDHAPVLQWLYAGMLTVRNVAELARHLTAVPLRGKGFALVAVDKTGAVAAPELACPLAQIRWPEPEDRGMNCVNYYQSPWLQGVTNRTAAQLDNCVGRRKFLEAEIRQGERSLSHMKQILCHHGPFGICRHGQFGDEAHTEFSMIGLIRQGKLLLCDGHPCTQAYEAITLG